MIKVYGASDDLVELEGDINEEFNYLGLGGADEQDSGGLLAFSNGVILRIVYTQEGVWRITTVKGEVPLNQAPEDDEDNYSDVAFVPPADWCVFGIEVAYKK